MTKKLQRMSLVNPWPALAIGVLFVIALTMMFCGSPARAELTPAILVVTNSRTVAGIVSITDVAYYEQNSIRINATALDADGAVQVLTNMIITGTLADASQASSVVDMIGFTGTVLVATAGTWTVTTTVPSNTVGTMYFTPTLTFTSAAADVVFSYERSKFPTQDL